VASLRASLRTVWHFLSHLVQIELFLRPHRILPHAVRSLINSPTLVVVATLSLGLGIGVNTTLYTPFRVVFFHPPTAVAADRLVRVEPGNGNQISYPNVQDLSPGGTIEGLAAYALTRLSMRRGATDEQDLSLMVLPAFFELLAVQPSIGRALGPDIDAAVITSAFWRRQLNGRPDPIGAVITLNGHAHTVVGVLPDGHRAVTGILGPDVYVPLSESLTPDLANRRRAFLTLLARLGPGVSPRQAGAEITARMQALERIYPEENAGFGRAAFVFPVSGLASWQTRDLPTTALVGITSVPFAIFGLGSSDRLRQRRGAAIGSRGSSPARDCDPGRPRGVAAPGRHDTARGECGPLDGGSSGRSVVDPLALPHRERHPSSAGGRASSGKS
jgi:MacB-like periplasmic core domain